MTVAIRSHFDGKVFVPDEPVDLPTGQVVILHVEAAENGDTKPAKTGNAWDVLEAHIGSISAPADWAAETDHYLHGTPKRSEESQK
jgi:hypothetical protein